MFLLCVSPCFSLLASLLRSVKRWLNMGRVPYQERVLAVVVEGATFRLKSQPVWTSATMTTFSGAAQQGIRAAKAHKAHFSQEKILS